MFTTYACAEPTPVVISKNTITYVAPITYINGEPLTDLLGYYAYCSDTSGVYSDAKRVQMPDPLQLSINLLTISGITDADVYCAVTAYTPDGESGYAVSSNLRVIGNDDKISDSATGANIQ